MVRIKYNKANVFGCGAITLLPGINKVSPADLEAAMQNPGFTARLNAGVIQVLDAQPAKSAKQSVPDSEAPAPLFEIIDADLDAALDAIEAPVEEEAPAKPSKAKK